jgi:hypothetical protein
MQYALRFAAARDEVAVMMACDEWVMCAEGDAVWCRAGVAVWNERDREGREAKLNSKASTVKWTTLATSAHAHLSSLVLRALGDDLVLHYTSHCV